MFRRLATVGMLAALVLVMSCGESARLPDPSPQTTSATSPSTGAPTPTTRPEPAEARPEAPATAEPSTFLTVGSGAFLGRVVSVDFGDAWAIDPSDTAVTPGAVAGTTVGPATIHLEDGMSLEVPASTPGGNACLELVRREDWAAITGLEDPTLEQLKMNGIRYNCFIYGALGPEGQMAWFDIATEYRDGDPTATLLRRPVDLVSEMLVVDGGLGFPLAADTQILCLNDLTVEEYAADLVGLAPRTVVEISTVTGEVTNIFCTVEF